MHLNCSKDELRSKLMAQIYNSGSLRLELDLNNSNGGGYHKSVSQTIQDHIDMKLNNIINAFVNSLYTNEEFEQDIGLR